MPKTLILCDCMGTNPIDSTLLENTTGIAASGGHSSLCTTQIDRAAKALTSGEAVICCGQESRVFDALAEELGTPPPDHLDLRDRAGWSNDPASKLPKMSALVAEAALPKRPDRTLDVMSEGLCLILGDGEAALSAATQLAPHLGVTVLLEDAADLPDTRAFDVIAGRLRRATGAFGGFEVMIDALRLTDPTGRGQMSLNAPRDGGVSECDIILDLRGGQPLFPAHEKRDGYLRADPAHPAGIAAAILAASHLVGTFEKTLHVRTEPLLCAHSRAEQTGCTRCLDLCPTGAIMPDGDHVVVDPMVCAGCGTCSAACPSGAISYDAPPVDHTMLRVQALASAYLNAGGQAPRLLAHDSHGAEMIRLSARHGRGLPADVIPMELPALGAFGHAEAVAALAAGFAQVSLLPGPQTDRAALEAQLALARAIGGDETVQMLDISDPEALEVALYDGAPVPQPVARPVRPLGTRRQITRQAASALHPGASSLPMPEGAPYGAVLVDTDACTLCLSCVSLCPSGALGDNPDRPQVRFQEDACLQCGLCATVCPEDAITYEPRLNLTETALAQQVLNDEEPFACIECGTPFGVKSTIERIMEKLQSHAMFSGDKMRMIQMCDDCRVNAQYHADNNPFAGGERPRPRTTEDYLSKRRDH